MKNLESNPLSLSGNALKIFAAVTMLIDHIGYILLPQYQILRIIGRLAFPIFAFMIAEGCKYTKNKLRYLLTMLLFAAVCQIVYYLYDGSTKMCVLVTFTLSSLMIFALQKCKKVFFDPGANLFYKALWVLLFLGSVAVVREFCQFVHVDYGFRGTLVPLAASLFRRSGENDPNWLKKLDCNAVHVLTTGCALLFLCRSSSYIQYYCLLSLPLLLCYSGKRGKGKMKYFFYIFYPAHLAVLEGISLLLG